MLCKIIILIKESLALNYVSINYVSRFAYDLHLPPQFSPFGNHMNIRRTSGFTHVTL